MKQEDKELILKDLYARLPYGVRIKHKEFDIDATRYYLDNIYRSGRVCLSFLEREGAGLRTGIEFMDFDKGDKPYLFPLSSMTREQREELKTILGESVSFADYNNSFYDMFGYNEVSMFSILKAIEWLNKNHFDYRGLIKKGLAIDATGLNIY